MLVPTPVSCSACPHNDVFRGGQRAVLDTDLHIMPATGKLVVLGDFISRVGRDLEQWRGDVGKHGVGMMNSNGLLLLSKCTSTTC